jgi:hypothetical protein
LRSDLSKELGRRHDSRDDLIAGLLFNEPSGVAGLLFV